MATECSLSDETRYASPIVERLRSAGGRLQCGGVEIVLAREFGFCYGVSQAVARVFETRRQHPAQRVFLTSEVIHNPRVNSDLRALDVGFIEGEHACGLGVKDLGPGDIVIIPAFGLPIEQIERIARRGCELVDTTCSSVAKVWKRVEKYAREGFTCVIHGKFDHEETRATLSRIGQHPGAAYAVVRNPQEAGLLCNCILGRTPGSSIPQSLLRACSPGFDPAIHLQKIGLANQTTMLSSESLSIAAMLHSAMAQRWGGEAAEHFQTFDTICSATEHRQKAIEELAAMDLDLILIVGGFNSSNTTHLVEIASRGATAWHVEDAGDLISAAQIRHKPAGQPPELADGWLKPPPLRAGFAAGASTPDRVVGEAVSRLLQICGEQPDQ